LLRLGSEDSLTQDNFSSDAALREDFEEERVPESPIDDVRLADAVAKTFQTRFDLGNHALVYNPATNQLAAARGVEADSPAYAQLLEWLRERPSDATFDVALAVIKVGLSVLPAAEREERVKRIIEACHEVAKVSGGGLARVLGLRSGVQPEEEALLDTIGARLRDHR